MLVSFKELDFKNILLHLTPNCTLFAFLMECVLRVVGCVEIIAWQLLDVSFNV